MNTFQLNDKVSLRRNAGFPDDIVDKFGVGVVTSPPKNFTSVGDHWADALNRNVIWVLWPGQDSQKWCYADELAKESA